MEKKQHFSVPNEKLFSRTVKQNAKCLKYQRKMYKKGFRELSFNFLSNV